MNCFVSTGDKLSRIGRSTYRQERPLFLFPGHCPPPLQADKHSIQSGRVRGSSPQRAVSTRIGLPSRDAAQLDAYDSITKRRCHVVSTHSRFRRLFRCLTILSIAVQSMGVLTSPWRQSSSMELLSQELTQRQI